jgi:hypothetical protein
MHKDSGKVSGLAVDRIKGFSPTGDSPRDFMDALADSHGIITDKNQRGPACPHPYPPRTRQKAQTDQDWAIDRALGRGRRTHFI